MAEIIKSDIQGVGTSQNDTSTPEVNQANGGELQPQATVEEARTESARERKRAELLQTMPYLQDLEKRLLSVGGKELIFAVETQADTELIVKEGRLFPTKYRKMAPGDASNCHGNAAALYLSGLNIATGYAMKEGLWRQHSWGLENYKTKSGKVVERIVETTVESDVYFGAVLDDQRALRFTAANLGRMPNEREVKVLGAKLNRLKM